MKNKYIDKLNKKDKEEMLSRIKKDVILSKGYYHIQCFRDRLNGGQNLKMLQSEALGFIKGAKKLVGIKDEPEVIIV